MTRIPEPFFPAEYEGPSKKADEEFAVMGSDASPFLLTENRAGEK
jgi:hypothetical protein